MRKSKEGGGVSLLTLFGARTTGSCALEADEARSGLPADGRMNAREGSAGAGRDCTVVEERDPAK